MINRLRVVLMTIPAVVLVAVALGVATPESPSAMAPISVESSIASTVHEVPSSTSHEERVVERPFDGRLLQSSDRHLNLDGAEEPGTAIVGARAFGFSDGHSQLVERQLSSIAVGD